MVIGVDEHIWRHTRRCDKYVTDEGFGRQLQVSPPDGLLIGINELQPEPYR